MSGAERHGEALPSRVGVPRRTYPHGYAEGRTVAMILATLGSAAVRRRRQPGREQPDQTSPAFAAYKPYIQAIPLDCNDADPTRSRDPPRSWATARRQLRRTRGRDGVWRRHLLRVGGRELPEAARPTVARVPNMVCGDGACVFGADLLDRRRRLPGRLRLLPGHELVCFPPGRTSRWPAASSAPSSSWRSATRCWPSTPSAA